MCGDIESYCPRSVPLGNATDFILMAEKMLKERKDVDANEKLLQTIKNNDKTFYAKLMKNKDALVLRKEDSTAKQALATKQEVSHESVPLPTITQNQESNVINAEKPTLEEVQKPATIIIDGKEYVIKEPPAQWQKPEEEVVNLKKDEVSSVAQKPKEQPAQKKSEEQKEQPIAKKPTFSGDRKSVV